MAGLILVIVFAVFTYISKTSIRKLQLRSCVLIALLFALGAFIRKTAEPRPHDVQKMASHDGLVLSIVQKVEATDYGCKTELRILALASGQRALKVISYVRDSMVLLPGDTLCFPGTDLEPIPAAGNPYAFDIAKYYRRQGIFLRCYLDSTNTILLKAKHHGLHLLRRSAQIRESVTKIYQTYLQNKQSCAVLLAMTIGVENWLDDKIYEAYARSGAIHVLSISGLHVGIVSVLLYILIGRSRQKDKLPVKLARATALVSGIWAFACIAGLSPSITRAALMFSIYLTGTVFRRPVKGMNVLAATAFICLAIDPFQINSVSFQFSYLALLGIVIFFKPLYTLVRVRTRGAKFVWGTIVMSIAAQVLLLPLLIHYFQQVSLISAFSSLVAIPASYGILIGGILLLPLHYLLPELASIAGYILDVGIEGVNRMILWMSVLPMSHVSNIYLPPVEVFILSSLTILLSLRVLIHNRKLTYVLVFAISAFSLTHIWFHFKPSASEILALYPHQNQILIDFVSAGTCYSTFALDTLPGYLAQEVSNFRNTSGVKDEMPISTSPAGTMDQIRVIDLPAKPNPSDTNGCRLAVILESDFGLLRADLISLKADWVVLSSGLNYPMRRATQEFCIRHRQNFHDLREHGTLYLVKHAHNSTYEKLRQNIAG